MKRYISLLLILALALGIAACTSRPEDVETTATPEDASTPAPTPELTPEPTPTPTTEPTPEITPEPTEPPYRNQFNGEGMATFDNTRPFAVMINNINVAQPQCGIGEADIIYEVLAEGGITRMMAIFSDIQSVDAIGSMRSIRPYYVDIALAYDAVTVHAGYSEAAISRIRSYGVNNICGVTGSYADSTFYRDPARMSNGWEHSLFTTGEKLYNCAESLGYALTVGDDYDTGLNFVTDAVPGDGDSAEVITVDFCSFKTTELTYHEDTGLYTAVQHGGDYYDGNTGENVTFTNVLVLAAPSRVIDSAGRLDVTLTGSGSGYFACGGKYVPVTWQRESLTEPFTYTLADGSELNLEVGKTYIAIIDDDSGTVKFA